MFLFLLISAELAILYTVFWYLYLREPKQARRIAAGNWGSYKQADTIDSTDTPVSRASSFAAQPTSSAVKSFMVPRQEEMILDLRTNHYVPLPKKRMNLLAAMLHQLDDSLSELNVKA